MRFKGWELIIIVIAIALIVLVVFGLLSRFGMSVQELNNFINSMIRSL